MPSEFPPPSQLKPPGSLRPWWHWLLLIAPAVEVLMLALFTATVTRLLGWKDPSDGVIVLLYNLPLAALLCVVIAFWCVRHKTEWAWLGSGVILTLCLLVLNTAAAFAGCSLGAPLLLR